MNLYLLTRKSTGYDQNVALLIASESEDAARATTIACRDECRTDIDWDTLDLVGGNDVDSVPKIHTTPCVWRDPTATKCELIGVAADGIAPGVLVRSNTGS